MNRKMFLAVLVVCSGALTLVGCGGSSGPPPCMGTGCAPTTSDYAFIATQGTVAAYLLDTSNGTVTTTLPTVNGPAEPSSVTLAAGKFLFVSDFVANAVSAFSVDSSTGMLTEVAGSPFPVQSGQGASGLSSDPSGKFLFVAQPNTNEVAAFTISGSGVLTAVAGSPFPAGTTPTNTVVDPSGKFLYVSDSEDALGSIWAFTIDSGTGVLTEIPGSPFATLVNGGPFGLAVHPNGKFLYAALAGSNGTSENKIAVEAIDSSTGVLSTAVGSPFDTGNLPNGLAIDAAGKFLYSANMQDNNVSAFTIDGSSGGLTEISGSPFDAGPGAETATVDPSGKLLFVTNQQSLSVNVYTIDAMSGALTTAAPITGSQGVAGVAVVQKQ